MISSGMLAFERHSQSIIRATAGDNDNSHLQELVFGQISEPSISEKKTKALLSHDLSIHSSIIFLHAPQLCIISIHTSML